MDPYSVFEFLDWIDQQNNVSDATVYHYAKGDTIKKILRENGIVLRLTRVEDFRYPSKNMSISHSRICRH